MSGVFLVCAFVLSATGHAAAQRLAGPPDGDDRVALDVKVEPGQSVADLFPGSTGDLHLAIRNPHAGRLIVESAVVGRVTTSDPTGCPADNIVIGASDDLHLLLGAGERREITLADVVAMRLDAPDACQGVSFVIAVRLSSRPDDGSGVAAGV